MSKILVVEDDSGVRQVILAALRLQRFETVEASNGEDGVRLAKELQPDLIICDILMPGMDGYQTLATLRQDARTATIPFVFLTGFADRSEVRQGMELGADDYLTKPFKVSELLAMVNARMRKQEVIDRRSKEQLDELRTNLTMALPHELLTPLNGILGYAQILIDEADSATPKDVVDSARQIEASARRLHRLIQNFLVYSQIELIAADPARKAGMTVPPAKHAHERVVSVSRHTSIRAGREADLKVEAGEGLVAISGEHLAKIVEEVVDNAFKFSERGKPVKVEGLSEGGTYVIRVTDRGRGMTPAQIKNVGAHMQFERRLYEQQGTGLGLTLARRLAELYGGRLELESSAGQGTTVTIRLPSGEGSADGGAD